MGVIAVPARRREICNEIGRSTWRAMNPSVSLTSERRSRRSAARTSAGVSTSIGSMSAEMGAGGPNKRASRPSTAPRSRAPPSRSNSSTAPKADAAASMTIRFGILPQAAGSIRIEASRSSQSVSARMAAGAMMRGAGLWASAAVRSRQSGIAAAPGVEAFCAKEKDLPIASAARRQRRPLDEAQPQNDRIAIRPARECPPHLGEAAEGARRIKIGASGMCLGSPMGDARHSTSATIADRRSRAAIVVPRSLRREPRPDGGPQPFQPRSSSPRFLASCSSSF